MNPPFPKKHAKRKEFLFIEQALKQMQHEGLLFCVLPYPCMIKGGEYVEWRRRLLNENTLLSVITFPVDLFYPIGVHAVGVFIRKGVPHSKSQKVFWLRALNDGFAKKKGKRQRNDKVPDDLAHAKERLAKFIKNPTSTADIQEEIELVKLAPIDLKDPLLELVPEAYLDLKEPTSEEIQAGMDDLVRQTAAFLIQTKREKEFESQTAN
jgi:type I restriction-modification system DNA methylase subunit